MTTYPSAFGFRGCDSKGNNGLKAPALTTFLSVCFEGSPKLCKACFLRFADTGAGRSIGKRSPGATKGRFLDDRLKV
jgi:hypothetical protein